MKAHTQTFKDNLTTLGKEINAKVTYTIDGVETELSGDELGSVTPHYEGNILKSVMKQVDIISDIDIPLNTDINVQFGLRYNTENYEYVDYGNYIVFSSEKQEDTNNYKIIAYDKMLYAMKDYEELEITYPITIRDYISAICTKLDLDFANANDMFANYDKEIKQELYANLGYTFRDVLDEIAQVTASTICINQDDELEVRYINQAIAESEQLSGTSFDLESDEAPLTIDEFDGEITQETTILPSGYTQVEYIQSDETNVINTGVLPSENIDIEIDIDDITTTNQFGSPCGYRNANTNQFWWYIDPSQNQRIFARWGTNNYSSNFYYTTGKRVKVRQNKNGLFINGTLVTSAFSSATITGNYNIYIFACNNNNASQWQTNSKLYRAKIWNNGTLIRDFIPCYRNNDNKIGVYDLVNNVFYTKQGTNEFTKGSNSVLPNPDYPQDIEISTGRQSIDLVGKNLCGLENKGFIVNTSGVVVSNSGYWYCIIDTTNANSLYVSGDFTLLSDDVIRIGGFSEYPILGSQGTRITYRSNSALDTTNYNYVMFCFGAKTGHTIDEIKNSFMITYGNEYVSYEPYKIKEHEINLGKNYLDLQDGTYTNNGVTAIVKDNVISINGTAGSGNSYINIPHSHTIEPKIEYTLSLNNDFTTSNTSDGLRLSTNDNTRGSFTALNRTKTFTFQNALASNIITIRLMEGSSINNGTMKVQLEKGSVATLFSPYFEPIFLGKINTYKDFIRRGTGKNLFDKDNANILNDTYMNSSTMKLASTTGTKTLYIPIRGGKTYTIQKIVSSRFAVATTTSLPQIDVSLSGMIQNNNATSLTITTNSNAKYLCVFFLHSSDTTSEQTILNSIMIEEGNTPTLFEPYGFKDKWYLYKVIGKVVLNGSENWSFTTWGTATYKRCFLTIDDLMLIPDNQVSPLYCSHFRARKYNDGLLNTISARGSGHQLNLWQDVATENNSAWKSWLGNNNILLYFPLTKPTTTEITSSNYPELYSQLKAIEKARTFEGVTYIDSTTPISIDYIKQLETIDEDYIKNTRADFGEKYGPINSIVLSRSADSDNIYIKDQDSIDENGLCEVKIKNNQIMNDNDRSDFLPDLLEYLKGIEYYINDFESIGITYLDLLDRYKVVIGDKSYYCVMLNDEVGIHDGLNEIIYTEKPKEEVPDYKKASTSDKQARQTYLMVDKQAQRIDAVVSTQEEFEDSLSSLTIDVDGIKSKVELNYDFVRETSGNNYVSVDDIQQEGLLELKITGTAISSGNLILHITNNVPEYIELPISTILKQGNVADELSIEAIYNEETELYELHCFIDKKLDYINNQIVTHSSSNNYLLANDSNSLRTESGEELLLDDYAEGKEDLGIINIPIQEGQHTFSIENFNNLSYYLKYAVLNNITSEFALKKHIVSEINQSAEEIQISADKVSLIGKTIEMTSDNININSDNFKVDSEGNMECTNATLKGTLIQDNEGEYYNTRTNIGDPYNTGNAIEVYSYDKTTNEEHFKTYINPGNIAMYYFGKLQALFGYGGVVYLYNAYNDTETRTIAINGENGNITCVSLTQTSKKESKKNFEKFDNALDVVKNVDIYKYNLYNEKDEDKKHIGFVIGDDFNYRKEITSKDNDGADIYAMVSVLWRAVQEQQEQIEKMQKEIDILKGGK